MPVRLIAPFFDGLIGVRVDHVRDNASATRALLSVGVEGLAPNWFEVGASAFVSQGGDLSARMTASYDLLLTQRLKLEPQLEANLSAGEVPEFGIGSGLTDVELGLRLRYEIQRKFAPYVGLNWERRFGSTADLARTGEGHVSEAAFVAGFRLWY